MKACCLVMVFLLSACAGNTRPAGTDSVNLHRAKIHTELGSGYYAQGLLATALDEFNEAIRIDPEYAVAYVGLGLVHAALNQNEEAQSNYNRALQLDPKSSEAHNSYGTFLCAIGRIDASLDEFLLAVKNPLYQTPEIAYLNAGTCLLKKNDDKNAEIYLTHALQLKPGLHQANYPLAQIYFGRKDYAEARRFLQSAMQNVEPGPDLLWLGLRIERQLGGSDAESSYAMLLKNKYPNSAQTRAMLSGE